MRIYFAYAGSYEKFLRESEVRIMISYIERKKGLHPEIPYGFPDVMIDSGGFQLQTGAADNWEITLGGYTRWLEELLPKHPEVSGYMNLDNVHSAQETLTNQTYMEKQGLKPIPIWHLAEDDSYLDHYCGNYEYVGIGGMVGGGVIRIKKAIERLTYKYPQTKFHFLGVGLRAFQTFGAARPYSVDFSSWACPGRWGQEVVEEGEFLVTKHLPLEERQRIRTDKELKMKYFRETIEKLKLLGDKVELMDEPLQIPMF